MLIYLDESGDLGFDFANKRPSAYFVITILVTENYSVLKSAVKRTLNNKINHQKKKRIVNELKGSATTLEIKKYFYNLLMQHDDWFLHTIILDKQHLLKNTKLTIDKEALYSLLTKIVLEEIETLNHAPLVHLHVDRSKNSKEIKLFDDYLRTNLPSDFSGQKTLNIEHLNSEKNAGLQAADIFCYGIARKYECNDISWYDLFKDKIKREIIYRP